MNNDSSGDVLSCTEEVDEANLHFAIPGPFNVVSRFDEWDDAVGRWRRWEWAFVKYVGKLNSALFRGPNDT